MFKSERAYFRLGAESYSSLERVGKKKEENSVVALRSLLNVFASDKFRVLACIGYRTFSQNMG